MNRLLFSLLVSTTSLFAHEAKDWGSLEVAEVVSVIDGDTIKVTIPQVHPLLGEKIPVRIAHIDTPELSSTVKSVQELAYKAKAFTEQVLQQAHCIELRHVRRDKYFRILAEVYVDNISLGDLLVQEGLAKPYHGKTKPDWEKALLR